MLHGHLDVVTIHLKVVDGGIHIFHLDIVRVECRSRLVGLFACLRIASLAVVHPYFVGLDLPRLIIGFFRLVFGHGMIFAILLGILFTRVLVIDVGLINIEFSHVYSLIACIHFHVLGFGMAHLGIKFIDSGLHVHFEVNIIGCDFVGLDFPGLTGLLVGIWLLLLRLITHLGFATLERRIIDVDLVVVQVDAGCIDVGIVHIHIQIH